MNDLFSGKMLFMQDGDGQLEVVVDDMGGGKFFTINATKWEFNKIEDLVALLKKVETAFEFEV